MIKQVQDRYLVFWGNAEESIQIMMEAQLDDGGDPAKPGDWRAGPYEPAR
jgi:hypothetical protein